MPDQTRPLINIELGRITLGISTPAAGVAIKARPC
jgi:hypothetical protein